MGTIRNEMTIVHCWNKDNIEKVREDAIKFFNEIEDNIADLMIGPIMQSYINQEYTFVINGDCSKIGWETSERFHEARIKWCERHKYDVQNIIVINFGEGDDPCQIVFDNKNDIISEDITKAGSQIEMLVDGTWIKGTVVKGYRYQDGIVTIETTDGHRYWCGQDRTDIYRRIKEN